MTSWNKIKDHGGLIALVALLIGGFWHMDNKFSGLHKDVTEVLVRLERHECHINYLMEGRKPILAPVDETAKRGA